MFLSSFILGLNTYGHFVQFFGGLVNVIKNIILPILSGYLESVLQVPQTHRFTIFEA